jgi:hypothetical protein
MLWVCPPQISMMAHSRVAAARIDAARSRATAGSRYSLRCFILGLELAEHFEGDARFVFIDALKGETGMGEDVVAGADVGRAVDADTAMDASESDVGFEDAVGGVGAEDLSGDG